MLETTRTYRAKIVNHQQVSDDLDECGFSASKLWNIVNPAFFPDEYVRSLPKWSWFIRLY